MCLARFFVIFIIFFELGCSNAKTQLIEPGARVINFKLSGTDGQDTELYNALNGKKTILHFWASWCENCVDELTSLQKLSVNLKDEISVVGIAVEDDPEDVKELIHNSKITFPVFIDKYGKMAKSFKVTGVPESFLVDKNNKLLIFSDPKSGPMLKVVGDRDWSTKEMVDSLKGS